MGAAGLGIESPVGLAVELSPAGYYDFYFEVIVLEDRQETEIYFSLTFRLLPSSEERRKSLFPMIKAKTNLSRYSSHAQGKTDTETNFVVTVGFTTKVDHQTTSKIWTCSYWALFWDGGHTLSSFCTLLMYYYVVPRPTLPISKAETLGKKRLLFSYLSWWFLLASFQCFFSDNKNSVQIISVSADADLIQCVIPVHFICWNRRISVRGLISYIRNFGWKYEI